MQLEQVKQESAKKSGNHQDKAAAIVQKLLRRLKHVEHKGAV